MFDAAEFPALRRVRPLPKRHDGVGSNTEDLFPPGVDESTVQDVASRLAAESWKMSADEEEVMMSLPKDIREEMEREELAFAATAAASMGIRTEELMKHADALSSQIALQSYYAPLIGGMHDLLKGQLQQQGRAVRGEVDYIDQLPQQGNAKKRKVPANVPVQNARNDASSGQEDEVVTVAIPTGQSEAIATASPDNPSSTPSSDVRQRTGRIPAITKAGLQHKETLKARKNQLAAVLGALSHGDTLALDQALSSASYSLPGHSSTNTLRIRLSRRNLPRLARAAKYALKFRHPDKLGLPTSEFSFVCPSATSDRLVATKDEVKSLRTRFENELAKQSAKAAKLAKASNSPTKHRTKKRNQQQQQQQRAPVGANGDQMAQFLEPYGTGPFTTHTPVPPFAYVPSFSPPAAPKTGKGKKKKRSALANASNPHHLRNYVPSRVLGTGPQHNSTSLNDLLGPLPLRFLSAEIPPPRRRKHAQQPQQLTNPGEEWICSFCEYELFYSEDQAVYKRAVRKRKKILKRRQRARERAAAAAAGKGPVGPKPYKDGDDGDDSDGYDDDDDGSSFGAPPVHNNSARWKANAGGEQSSYG